MSSKMIFNMKRQSFTLELVNILVENKTDHSACMIQNISASMKNFKTFTLFLVADKNSSLLVTYILLCIHQVTIAMQSF